MKTKLTKSKNSQQTICSMGLETYSHPLLMHCALTYSTLEEHHFLKSGLCVGRGVSVR
uniref:Uncharacterized protein n=1 Tax=Anguilla anguilla TaxID=7936 RepID=A0A0E9WW55_ANGAN